MKTETEITEKLQTLYSQREKLSNILHNSLSHDKFVEQGSQIALSFYSEKISALEWVLDEQSDASTEITEPSKPDKDTVWNEIVQGLEKKTDYKKYPNSEFLFKDGKVYFEYDKKNNFLWASWDHVWGVFVSELHMFEREVDAFIKSRTETIFPGAKVDIPVTSVRWPNREIEDHFKNLERDGKINTLWNEIVNGLESKTDFKAFPGREFWIKNGNIYFEYNNTGTILLCSWEYVWSVFRTEFGMHDLAIQKLIAQKAENFCKYPELNVRQLVPSVTNTLRIEEHFRNT